MTERRASGSADCSSSVRPEEPSMTTQAGGRPSNLPVLWLKPTWQSCEKPVGAPMTIVLGSSSSSPPSALRSLENSLSRLRGGSAAIFSQHEPSKTLARFLPVDPFLLSSKLEPAKSELHQWRITTSAAALSLISFGLVRKTKLRKKSLSFFRPNFFSGSNCWMASSPSSSSSASDNEFPESDHEFPPSPEGSLSSVGTGSSDDSSCSSNSSAEDQPLPVPPSSSSSSATSLHHSSSVEPSSSPPSTSFPQP